MRTQQIDFNRIKRNGLSISIDTSLIRLSDGTSYYETASKLDQGTDPVWVILHQTTLPDFARRNHDWAVSMVKANLR